MTDPFDLDISSFHPEEDQLYRQRTLAEVVGGALAFLQRQAGPLARTVGGIALPFALAGGALGVWAWETEAGLAFVGLFFVIVLGMVYINTSIYASVRLHYLDGPGALTFSAVWTEVGRIFWPLVGISLLTGFLSGLLNTLDMVPVIGPWLNTVLSVLAIPPLTLAVTARMFGASSASEALERGIDLTRRYPRLVVGHGLVVVGLALVLVVVLSFGVGFLWIYLVDALGLSADDLVLPTVGVLLVLLLGVGLPLYIFYTTSFVQIYGSVVEHDEGVSLDARVAAIEAEDDAATMASW